jgi:hypothetical protein
MMWQMWTAFGIMLGYVMDVAFMNVKTEAVPDLNWRIMLASACVPPILVCAQVYFCVCPPLPKCLCRLPGLTLPQPESPRFEMSNGRHRSAFESLSRLRWSRVQAARDTFYMNTLLEAEGQMATGMKKLKEMFTVGRNRRAMQASELVMFMQQFCGSMCLRLSYCLKT